MSRRRILLAGERLVQGLTHDERLARLEDATFGDARRRGLVERTQEAESAIRRLQMPWVVRVIARFKRA